MSTQQYFLGIAIEYGDYARAEAIQANIAELQADMADKTAELNDEQSNNSKTLVGNSKAAINNRKQLESLVQQYQAHIKALAASGMSADDLARRTEELRRDFINQATQLGYNRAELGRYEQAFDDVSTAIRNVPRNITVTADTNPALQALNELEARARQVAGGNYGGINIPVSTAGVEKAARGYDIIAQINDLEASMARLIAAGDPMSLQGARYTGQAIRQLTAKLNAGTYAQGGYTGPGGTNQPAGIVHRGEYVIPKRDVNQNTGLPKADALGRLLRGSTGSRGYATGGYVGGSSGASVISAFGPMAVQQLATAIKPYLMLDGKTISTSSASQYANTTAVGAY